MIKKCDLSAEGQPCSVSDVGEMSNVGISLLHSNFPNTIESCPAKKHAETPKTLCQFDFPKGIEDLKMQDTPQLSELQRIHEDIEKLKKKYGNVGAGNILNTLFNINHNNKTNISEYPNDCSEKFSELDSNSTSLVMQNSSSKSVIQCDTSEVIQNASNDISSLSSIVNSSTSLTSKKLYNPPSNLINFSDIGNPAVIKNNMIGREASMSAVLDTKSAFVLTPLSSMSVSLSISSSINTSTNSNPPPIAELPECSFVQTVSTLTPVNRLEDQEKVLLSSGPRMSLKSLPSFDTEPPISVTPNEVLDSKVEESLKTKIVSSSSNAEKTVKNASGISSMDGLNCPILGITSSQLTFLQCTTVQAATAVTFSVKDSSIYENMDIHGNHPMESQVNVEGQTPSTSSATVVSIFDADERTNVATEGEKVLDSKDVVEEGLLKFINYGTSNAPSSSFIAFCEDMNDSNKYVDTLNNAMVDSDSVKPGKNEKGSKQNFGINNVDVLTSFSQPLVETKRMQREIYSHSAIKEETLSSNGDEHDGSIFSSHIHTESFKGSLKEQKCTNVNTGSATKKTSDEVHSNVALETNLKSDFIVACQVEYSQSHVSEATVSGSIQTTNLNNGNIGKMIQDMNGSSPNVNNLIPGYGSNPFSYNIKSTRESLSSQMYAHSSNGVNLYQSGTSMGINAPWGKTLGQSSFTYKSMLANICNGDLKENLKRDVKMDNSCIPCDNHFNDKAEKFSQSHGIKAIIQRIGQPGDEEVNCDGQETWYRSCVEDLTVQDKDGDTILHIAIAQEDDRAIDFIKLINREGLDIRNKEGQTPLHVASYIENVEIITALLHAKANIGIVDKDGNSPLHIGCEKQSLKVVDCLLQFYKGNLESLNILMSHCNNQGLSPLHLATRKRAHDIVKLLVHNGFALDIQDEKCGSTALVIALVNRDKVLIKLFIEKGANVNLPTLSGHSPLYFAAQCGDIEIVHKLLSRDAKFGCKSPELSELSNEVRVILDKVMRKRRRKRKQNENSFDD